MLDPQQLIDAIVDDAQRDLAAYDRAHAADDERAMDLTSHRLAGTRVALGRALAWRDGDELDGVVSAFNRGRDFQDTLTAA